MRQVLPEQPAQRDASLLKARCGQRSNCPKLPAASGWRRIQKWLSYKIHLAAAPAENRRRSAMDIEEAINSNALLGRHILLRRITGL